MINAHIPCSEIVNDYLLEENYDADSVTFSRDELGYAFLSFPDGEELSFADVLSEILVRAESRGDFDTLDAVLDIAKEECDIALCSLRA